MFLVIRAVRDAAVSALSFTANGAELRRRNDASGHSGVEMISETG